MRNIFITATDTGIGKTLIASAICYGLRRNGHNVGAMKPFSSGDRADINNLLTSCGITESLVLANQYHFKAALAPMPASEIEGKAILLDKVSKAYKTLSTKYEYLVIEGAGGLLVPIKKNYFMIDLIKDFDAPAILIARAGLGTINHTLLSIKAMENAGIKISGIIFNQTSPKTDMSYKTNKELIKKFSNVRILGNVPYIRNLKFDNDAYRKILKNIDLNPIMQSHRLLRRPADSRPLAMTDKKYVWHPFTQMKDYLIEDQLIIEEGKGAYLKDTEGKWYLDGVSSLWVNVHGHRKKELDEALKKQVDKISHSTLLGLGNVPSIELAKMLIEIAPKSLAKVFYSDSGSTAVEIALKIAFQYWRQKGQQKKQKFISFANAYHGDTVGSVSVGGMDLFHEIYKPLLFKTLKAPAPYCYRCPLDLLYPNCKITCVKKIETIMKENKGKVAGLIIEPVVQGAAGMLTQPKGFLKEVRRLCDKYDILMICDEVATGFGRTGKMFACAHKAVLPDILCLAKSITGGYLPLAATLTTQKIFDGFLGDYKDRRTFFHGHTYTGNPLACAVAIENLNLYKKEKILQKLQSKIKFLKDELKKFKQLKHVGDIRQAGFMVGIELVSDKKTRQQYLWSDKIGARVIKEARGLGAILRPLGNVIVLMPPFSIKNKELRQLLDITYKSIEKVTENE